MDVVKQVVNIRDEGRALVESLSRAIESCDTPEELEQLNAYFQSARQVLQNLCYLVGKALEDRNKA